MSQYKVTVTKLPTCDFCKHPSNGNLETPAKYDFKTKFGPWANACEEHYLQHRAYRTLGLGKGQELTEQPRLKSV